MRSGTHQTDATAISRPLPLFGALAIRVRAVPIMPILAVLYVVLISVAELLTVFADARWGLAFLGGGLMGIGAGLARGCTSGQALSGGAVLSVGSWAFMMMVFAGAYMLAYPLRKLWNSTATEQNHGTV